jgi:hypothetical protein
MDKLLSSKTNLFLFFLLIVSICLVGTLYLINQKPQPTNYQNTPNQPTSIPQPTSTPIPTATPTPTPRPIPHGKEDFFVSIGSGSKGPKMGKGTIDPYDPALNSQQQLTIEVGDPVGVSQVETILETDHKKIGPFQLKLINGDNKSGNWNGEWLVDDSYLYKYVLTINATGASGQSSVSVTLR